MEEDKEKEEPIAAGMDEGDEEKEVSAENETKEAVTGIRRSLSTGTHFCLRALAKFWRPAGSKIL